MAILVLYWPLPLQLNRVLFSFWSDADRAFRVYMEFALGQASGVWLDSWLFPYGEHLFYLDANPVLCWFSGLFFSVFPFLRPYATGVFNALILAQLLFTHLGWYRLARFRGVPAAFAGILALSIAVLSPQWLKNNGNFSLAYTFLFPWLCLALWKANSQEKGTRAVFGVAFWVGLSVLIHPYLGLVHGAFAALWMVFARPFQLKGWWNAGLVVVPLLLFVLFLSWSDPSYPFRTREPWGATDNQMTFVQWVIPAVGHVNDVLQIGFGDFGASEAWEFAFIPWSIWWAIVVVVVLGWGRKLFGLLPSGAWLSALILLLFSSGVFGLTRFSWLFEVVPFLKQFRFVLRFAWPMYGVLAFSVGLALYGALKTVGGHRRYIFWVLVGIPVVVEAHGQIRFLREIHMSTPNVYSSQNQSEQMKGGLALLRSERPAALFTEPFLFEGSLMTAGENSGELRRMAYVLSVLGETPLIGGILIRPNEEHALATGGFSTEPWYAVHPDFQRALKGKTVAILYSEDLDWNLPRWKNRKPFKAVDLDSNFRLGLIRAEDWMRVQALPVVAALDSVHLDLMDDQKYRSAPPFGNAARLVSRNEFHVVLDTVGLRSGAYEASVWVDARRGNSVNGVLFVEEVNQQGEGQWVAQANPARSRCLDGGWARCALTFEAKAGMRYKIVLTAYDFQAYQFGLNRFMLRPVGINSGGKFGAYQMWNNHWQKMP